MEEASFAFFRLSLRVSLRRDASVVSLKVAIYSLAMTTATLALVHKVKDEAIIK